MAEKTAEEQQVLPVSNLKHRQQPEALQQLEPEKQRLELEQQHAERKEGGPQARTIRKRKREKRKREGKAAQRRMTDPEEAEEQGGEQAEAAGVTQCILELLSKRKQGASICPSEVARALYPAGVWRGKMTFVREMASALIDKGAIVATQKRRVIDIRTVKGPIRLAFVLLERRGKCSTYSK